jgi:hypothetical protein
MKAFRFVRGSLIAIAALGLCIPQVALAATPTPTPPVMDVALGDGGVLHGQVVDLQGSGQAGVPVFVKAQARSVATTVTSADGTFNVQGLRGGVYHVAAAKGQGVYRAWSAGTAPPAAQKTAMVYTQNGTVPSDVVVYTAGGFAPKMLLTNPIVIAGVVATAVAVPVALANSHPASP